MLYEYSDDNYISLSEFNSNIDKRIHKDYYGFEFIKPIESSEYQDFFYVNSIFELVISKDLKIIHLVTGKILSELIDKNDRNKKYHRVRVGYDYRNIDKSKVTKRYSLSRVIALAFIPRPIIHKDLFYDLLEVNHIDGNPENNSIVNLEWCTPKENALHARIHIDNSYMEQTLAKNIITGDIKVFKSLAECGKVFNVPKTTLHWHLTTGLSGTAYKDNHIFKFDDGTNWLDLPISDMYEIGDGSYEAKKRKVIAKHIYTGDIKHFESIKECSEYFKFNHVTIRHFLNKTQPANSHYNFWVFKEDNDSDWPILDIKNVKPLHTGHEYKSIRVKHGDIIYRSVAHLADSLGIPESTIRKHVKKGFYETIS